MAQFSFLVNARPSTLSREFLNGMYAGGILFPPDRAAAATVAALAGPLRRRFVLADNGAYDTIGKIAASLPPSADNAARVKAVRTAAGAVDPNSQLAEQLAVRPDAVIGPEDITLACWLRAGVGETDLVQRRSELRRRNRSVARRGLTMQAAHPELTVYTVPSAHDYDSAFDAGQALGDTGVRAVAMGFGAFMADDSWTTRIKYGGRWLPLPQALPMRYLRTALVVRGFFDGWAAGGSAAPDRFHFLGLGAPVMLPLSAYAARSVRSVTYDATSPIKDAAQGTLYVSEPAKLKVRTWNVLERMVLDPAHRWNCPCQFCRAFCLNHPFDEARIQMLASRSRPLTAADLRVGRVAAQAVPLFAVGPGPLGRAAEQARAGHNHWTVGLTLRRLSAAVDLRAAAAADVAAYVANAGAAHFGQSVAMAWDLVSAGNA
ncbi:hypothetical protein [Micromonospora sp. NPDC004551]|uniref:hypothetical protein n=1 Tax=Micromonospora sp. NPDC004551 TaxID=3154284 RepID=UPI0033AF93EE